MTIALKTPAAKRVRFGLAICAISLVAEALFFACLISTNTAAEETAEPKENTPPALTVTSNQPRTMTWPVAIKAYGSVAPWEEASIGAQIGGYQLSEVRVNVGDVVKKGQVLARFDPALLLTEQMELQARADQASANLQRALSLQNRKAISEQDALQAVTQSKIEEALLAKNTLQLEYTEVRAPDDGVISARSATLGATVPLGQELFQLIRQQRLEWRGELNATQLSQVKVGQNIALLLADGTSACATVRQLSPSLSQDTRLAIVYADVCPGSRLKAGMYVAGNIAITESDALTVPAKSVVIRDGRDYILTLENSGPTSTVSLRKVEVGRRQQGSVEITRGLQSDDTVVVDGAGFLSDGDVVRVVAGSQNAGLAQP